MKSSQEYSLGREEAAQLEFAVFLAPKPNKEIEAKIVLLWKWNKRIFRLIPIKAKHQKEAKNESVFAWELEKEAKRIPFCYI